MWEMRSDWVKRGFRLRSSLWVACIVMSSGRMTWGPLLIFRFLLHGVFTLIGGGRHKSPRSVYQGRD